MIDKKIIVQKNNIYSEIWHKLLAEWFTLIDIYCSVPDGDVPYWYGERALTGLLASAAWRLKKGWSLEEFTAERGGDNKTGKGRGDLWLCIEQLEITIEAKVCWPETDLESAITMTKRKLNEAKGQLQNLSEEYRFGSPFSVCYVVPYPRKFNFSNPKKVLDHITERFAPENCIIGQYAFQDSAPIDSGRVYPGVILVAREEQW